MRTLLGLLLLVAGASGAARSLGAQGIVAGVVRDEAGLPLAGARISIQRDSVIAVLSRADGSFSVANVPAGQRSIEVMKVGYRPVEAMIMVPADSAVLVNIILVALPQQLPGVVVDAALSNQVRGVVLDRDDKPVDGVIVEVVGLNRKMATGEAGEFWFADLPPGTYLMQWRKTGYAVSHRSVQMVIGIDRDISVRLSPIGKNRFTAELAAVVAAEASVRQGMAGSQAIVIGRDELDTFGKARLVDALRTSSGATAFRDVPQACVLVNGHEPATTGGAGALTRQVVVGGRGPTSIGGNTPGGRVMVPSRTTAVPPPMSWLAHYRANEVEMVEIYPQGSEHSRTLCGRFSTSSGCSCPPDPAGVVIWLR